jgi:hypothetical protein
MLPNQLNLLTKTIVLTLIINFNWLNFTHLAQAQTKNSSGSSQSTKTTSQEANSNRNGLPSNRISGGSRGSCLAGNHSLVALVPEENVSLTASASPKLFFYVPATNSPRQLEFVLRNQNDELVYEAFVDTNNQSGIIPINLPKSVKSDLLEANQDYHWYLSMICNPQRRSQDLVVEGWIRRIELKASLAEQLRQCDPVEQAMLYNQNGIWYDALAALAEEQQSSKWSELLASVGLGDLAQEPIIQVSSY